MTFKMPEPVACFSPSGALYRSRFHAAANGEQLASNLYTAEALRDVLEQAAMVCHDMGFCHPTIVAEHALFKARDAIRAMKEQIK